MESEFAEETTLDPDEVRSAVSEVQEKYLRDVQVYQHSRIPHLMNEIMEEALHVLVQKNKPYKFILNCSIVQKVGAGIHSASSCFWDNTTDDCVPVEFETKILYSVLHVYWCAL